MIDLGYWRGSQPATLAGTRVDVSVGAMDTDVITAAALATDAIAEIQSGLSTLDAAAVNSEVADALADVGLSTIVTARLDVAVSSRGTSTLTAIEVNAEVLDVLTIDTFGEPTGAPAVSEDLATKLGYLYEVLRNKMTVTASAFTYYDNAGTAQWSKALTDDTTTYLEAEGA